MLQLAIRQMMARKRQTTLIFLGIGFGTMIYILIAGLQFGFREYLIEQLLNNTAHVIIKGKDRTIDKEDLRDRFFGDQTFIRWIVPPAGKRKEAKLEHPQGWFSRLEKDPDVLAFAPRLTVNALVSQGRHQANISMVGIVPKKQIKVTSLEEYMKEGSLLNLTGGANKIILGSGVLESIGASVGETVQITTGIGTSLPFKVVGTLHLGNKQVDDTIVLTHIRNAQTLNRSPGRVSEISVALVDMDLAIPTAQKWSLYGLDQVQSWQEANAQFMQMITIQDIMRLVMTGAILLVASFGIYNVLSIMINQKKKEIAILRAIGYGPERIFELFLYQGLILGLTGGLLGSVMGLGFNLLLGTYKLSFEVGKSNHLPISYDLSIYLTAMVASQLAAACASYLPSRAAAKMTPMDIIREGM